MLTSQLHRHICSSVIGCLLLYWLFSFTLILCFHASCCTCEFLLFSNQETCWKRILLWKSWNSLEISGNYLQLQRYRNVNLFNLLLWCFVFQVETRLKSCEFNFEPYVCLCVFMTPGLCVCRWQSLPGILIWQKS